MQNIVTVHVSYVFDEDAENVLLCMVLLYQFLGGLWQVKRAFMGQLEFEMDALSDCFNGKIIIYRIDK